MSLCSWLRGQISNAKSNTGSIAPVPSNHRVQEILVEIGDKEKNFLGSKQWIGSVEVCCYAPSMMISLVCYRIF